MDLGRIAAILWAGSLTRRVMMCCACLMASVEPLHRRYTHVQM